MHVLFLHQNYPAQFGMIVRHLVADGHRVSFVSRKEPGSDAGIERIHYEPKGGATAAAHYSSRTFENCVWHAHAVYDALKTRSDIKPDLVVGHAGFVSTVLLRELYDAPVVNYFEYYYNPTNSDLDFRPDTPPLPEDRLRSYFRNAPLLVDLTNCDLGYAPTVWQRDRLPAIFHPKIRAIFDGIDTELWKPHPRPANELRRAGRFAVPDGVKLVTYVARGFESIRGFDVFMKVAKKLYERRPDVRFVVVGQDRVCYGGDDKRTGGLTYKQWVLAQDDYDLSKFAFVGTLSQQHLAELFSITDLHLYLTVPFVLSWSLMNALACGAVVLASSTAPVREMITHGQNGLLADFFDADGFTDQAAKVLDAPDEHRPLGENAIRFIRERYSVDVCLPQLRKLFDDAAAMRAIAQSGGTR